jgi:CHAT domain-containing protein
LTAVVAVALPILILAGDRGQAQDPTSMRDRASAVIEAFIDNFRRTGDRTSKLPELDAAAADLATATRALAATGDVAGSAQAQLVLANAYRMRARWDEAQSAYRSVENTARQIVNKSLLAKSLRGQAMLEGSVRDYGNARAHADEALALSREVGDKALAGDVLLIIGDIQVKLADFSGAADSVNQALALAEERGDDVLRYYALNDRADIWRAMGFCLSGPPTQRCIQQLDLAVQNFRLARDAANRLGWTGIIAETDAIIGRTELQAQNIRSMLATNKTIARLSTKFKPKSAKDVLVSNQFVVSNPEGAAALRPAREQLAHMDTEGGGFSEIATVRARYIDGLFHQMQGDFDAALTSYRSALEVFESDRGKLRDESDRSGYLADKLNLYYRPIEILLEKHEYAQAFDLFERSKSRAMADLLASRSIGFASETDRRLFALLMEQRTRIAGLQSRLFLMLNQNRPAAEIAQINADIKEGDRRYQDILAQMKESAAKARDLAVSQPASLEQLQATMQREDFDVLMYLVDASGVTLWHIGANDVHVRNVFLPQNELSQKVQTLYESLTDSNVGFDAEIARELYLFLFAPARPWIKSKHLVIIPHGDLHQVPFEVLQNPDGGSFVGEEFQLSYAPSASILLGMRPPSRAGGERLLAVADPDLKAEAEAVAELYPGRATVMAAPPPTKASVKAQIGKFDVVHLSVHGEFDGRQPLLSHLKLAAGDGDDGRLTAAEMFGLDLDRADLVVLSACETGMATVAGGDEVIGMIRALLFAGARSFVLSRWKVDVASTSLWMKTFHAEAKSKPVGEAARSAIAAVRAVPAFRDPHYWAAFMLVGR